MARTNRKADVFLATLDAYIQRMIELNRSLAQITVTPAQLELLRKVAKQREHDQRFTGEDEYRGYTLRVFDE